MTDVVRLSPDSEGYPRGLFDVEEPPAIYVTGSLSEEPAVAVVGTRKCTGYGVGLAESFGGVLAGAGWTTVSGLARGIDAAAHRGTLRAGGRGVAVLGTGVDVIYPRENLPIYERLLELGGAVISEYPNGTPPDRWRFPARNRIIAAISAAVVVVEAAQKGGALITARLAAEIGRPVFVVPGDVDRTASEGCNRLIKDGAHPVLGPADLIEELSLVIGPPRISGPRVVNVLPEAGASIEELAEQWSVDIQEVMRRIAALEIEGSVRRDAGLVFPT